MPHRTWVSVTQAYLHDLYREIEHLKQENRAQAQALADLLQLRLDDCLGRADDDPDAEHLRDLLKRTEVRISRAPLDG